MADYSIRSYWKLWSERQEFGYKDFILFVYLNCVSDENKELYLERWSNLPFIKLFDNHQKVLNLPYDLKPGQSLTSPEGIKRERDDYAESYDELWTSELHKFSTPFIATVDADFEILNADFYFSLINTLKEDENLIGASATEDITSSCFDSYSQRKIILHARNSTWFCLYKKKAFELSNISHFYYENVVVNGLTEVYNSSAYFQESLKNAGFKFTALNKDYRNSFLHYGAGSKNRSLNNNNIGIYRRLLLFSRVGLFTGKISFPLKVVNYLVRKIVAVVMKKYLLQFGKERTRYIWDDSLTA